MDDAAFMLETESQCAWSKFLHSDFLLILLDSGGNNCLSCLLLLINSSTAVRQGGNSSCFLFTFFVNSLIRKLNQLNPDGFLHFFMFY